MTDENIYIQQRAEKAENLRKQGINPYTNDVRPSANCGGIAQQYNSWDKTRLEGLKENFSLAGRVIFRRDFGKAGFIKIRDRTGEFQVFCQKNSLPVEAFELYRDIDIGDFVMVEGNLFRTKTGELTLKAEKFRLVAKALRNLPEKWHGLTDVETRYRQRYVDLIVNPGVRETFVKRSKIISFIRQFFLSREYLEVETPMMHPIPGGAAARPFVTHHNTLDVDVYLRIAPELYLKRLVVGGLERVFEINRNFRNEGVSVRHNPEFTMLEFYESYSTYEDLMRLTEELLSGLVHEVCGTTKAGYQGETIDFTPPFARISYQEMLKIGEAGLVNPTFVTGFPTDKSPLARRSEADPAIADRFELYIAGMEVANAFSELNDPADQKERFLKQAEARKKGDEEAMYFDADYIRALEYGMPPTAGEGIGIDRLVMLLTDSPSIRDVILFPQLRPEK
ncbi:MAG: lysine--tRNA ligase [Deltaproteobacteria bacterium]|nr:lysine--tRNA ligase [Deltaproteobacteria bacterium]